jgi:hypothetical protein
MSKKTESSVAENNNYDEQTKAIKAQRQKEAEDAQRVSKRIQEILVEEGFALQPVINPNITYGIVPGVRLVKNPDANQGETGESKD